MTTAAHTDKIIPACSLSKASKGVTNTSRFAAVFNANSHYSPPSDTLSSSARTTSNSNQIHFAIGECPLGQLLVAQTTKGICAIMLGDDAKSLIQQLQDRFAHTELVRMDKNLQRVVAQVVSLIENPRSKFSFTLDIQGTVFQQQVWQTLQQIPTGTTTSYKQIAEKIGAANATRAVANACAANKIAIVIPCHRVLRADGNLSGYRWGVQRKRQLIEREQTAK